MVVYGYTKVSEHLGSRLLSNWLALRILLTLGDDDFAVEEGHRGDDTEQLHALRSASIGCADEEQLRLTRWRSVPPPEDDDDDDYDGEEYDCGGDFGGDGANGTVSTKREVLQHPDSVNFVQVLGEMVSAGLKANDPPENIIMEIRGFKFAQNKVKSLLHYCEILIKLKYAI